MRDPGNIVWTVVCEPDVPLPQKPVSTLDERAHDEVRRNQIETTLLTDRVGALDRGRLLTVTDNREVAV